jgi:hypothetical protein
VIDTATFSVANIHGAHGIRVESHVPAADAPALASSEASSSRPTPSMTANDRSRSLRKLPRLSPGRGFTRHTASSAA